MCPLRVLPLTTGLFAVVISCAAYADGADRESDIYHPLVNAQPEDKVGYWRDPNHDGVNAIFLMMRLNGFTESYGKTLQAIGASNLPQTVKDVEDASTRLGYPLVARRLSPSDTDKMPLPAIMHLDGDSPANGKFVIVVQILPTYIRYIDGGLAIFQAADRENFFRRWSGIALFPLESGGPPLSEMIVAMCLSTFVVWLARRRGP